MRRTIARLSVAACFVVLLIEAIASAVDPRYPVGPGLAACAASVLGIAGGLVYLRSTRGRQ